MLAATALIAASSLPAAAADLRLPKDAGLYGGISLRAPGNDAMGVSFGHLSNEWSRFAFPAADEGSRTLMFGGYRLQHGLAVEAAVETAEHYGLQRPDGAGRSGIGLALPGGSTDVTTRAWNVDVYGSWAFWRSLSLYGRMGYQQADAAAVLVDPRRARDGVNYGVGLRYDMTRSLGLKLEYARFGHLYGEAAVAGSTMPESDQVQFGLQYRF